MSRGKSSSGTYDVLLLSEYILDYYKDYNKPITHIRLEGLLYFVQAWFLAELDKPCFQDFIEARESSPIVMKVKERYSSYGAHSIPYEKEFSGLDFEKEDEKVLNDVLSYTLNWSDVEMSRIIHSQKPYTSALDSFSRVIDTHKLKKYFR